MKSKSSEFGGMKAWVVCLAGSLFFFYTFIQMAMLNSLGEPMMRDLGMQATQIASLSAAYFYANILFLFPAGIILDRYSTRKIVLLAISVMTVTTAALAFVNGLNAAMLLRFVFGLAGSFCLLANVRLATRWFPPQRLAFVIGVLIMVAMSGSLVAQTPFTVLVDAVGWRMSFGVDALIGATIAGILFLSLRDHPSDSTLPVESHRSLSFRDSILPVLRNSQNWLAGLYTSLMNLPVMIMFVFGSLFLEQTHGMDRTSASLVMTLFLIGVILGCPAFGWISDKLGRRKMPMIIASLLAVVVALPLLKVSHLTTLSLYEVFFALGFITSAQVISYPLVAESNPPELTGTAEGVASIIIMSGGLASQLFAYLLRVHWTPHYSKHVPQYGLENYHSAMLLIPAALVLALITAFFLKDVRQEQAQESSMAAESPSY
jgi:MFS family permease